MSQQIAHFRGTGIFGALKPMFYHVHPFDGVAGFYISYDPTSYAFSAVPDIAEVHLDVGSTLGITSIRLQLHYLGAPDNIIHGTSINFDHTWHPEDFKILNLNSNQRNLIDVADGAARQKMHAVNGLGNTAKEDTHIVDERTCIALFASTGTFDDSSGVKIVTVGPEDPSIISAAAPPHPPNPITPGFDPQSYWQLKRFCDAFSTNIVIFDPLAADGNGNFLNIVRFSVASSDFNADPHTYVVAGSLIHGWGESQGGPPNDANWDFTLTFSRA